MRAWWMAAVLLGAGAAGATEHHFTYSYETGVLNPGDLEVEPWTTARFGRDGFYDRFDERLELEAGIVPNLQMSLYLNLTAIDEDVGAKRVSTTSFQGLSWETKWKLLDPVADPVGLALYAEPSLGPDGAELEGKVIVDKRFGNFLTAGNLVVEHEMDWSDRKAVHNETEVKLDGGLAILALPNLSLGLELRDVNVIAYDDGPVHWESSVLFAGPTVSWSTKPFWVAFTVLPQIAAPLGPTSGVQNYEDFERVETRLAVGVHL